MTRRPRLRPRVFFVRILAQADKTAQSWHEHIAADRTQFLKAVIERVVIPSVSPRDLSAIARSCQYEILGSTRLVCSGHSRRSHRLTALSATCSKGRALRLIIGDTSITSDASRQIILKAIARARHWYEQITTGQARSIAQLAGLNRLSPRLVRMHMKLVQLGPPAIETMMRRPHSLPLSLTDLLAAIPMNWGEQISCVAS